MSIRYRFVSNSWKPSSPKLKIESTICWVNTFIESMSAAASVFSLRDPRFIRRRGGGRLGLVAAPLRQTDAPASAMTMAISLG